MNKCWFPNQLHLKRTGLKFPMSQRPVKGGSDPRPKEANVQLHSNPLTMKIVGKILKWKLSIVKSLAILICKSTKLLIEREANHFRWLLGECWPQHSDTETVLTNNLGHMERWAMSCTSSYSQLFLFLIMTVWGRTRSSATLSHGQLGYGKTLKLAHARTFWNWWNVIESLSKWPVTIRKPLSPQ